MVGELDVECQAIFVRGIDSDFFELLFLPLARNTETVCRPSLSISSLAIMADTCSIPRHIVQLYPEHRGDGNAELAAADAISTSMPQEVITDARIGAELPSLGRVLR